MRSFRYSGEKMGIIDNFKFDRSVLSLEISDNNWTGLYFENNIMAEYYHRIEEGCSIEVRQIRLKDLPKDEKSAVQIYENMLPTINPNFMIRGGRPSDRVKLPSSFPYTYSMATSANAPPLIMNTVFVHPPYLYSIRLKVASELKGPLRTDLYALLESIRIEPQEGDPTTITSTANGSDTNVTKTVSVSSPSTLPIKTSPTESNLTQNISKPSADEIKKMVAEAYGTNKSSTPLRGDHRVGKGDGTSPLDGLIDKLNLDHRTSPKN